MRWRRCPRWSRRWTRRCGSAAPPPASPTSSSPPALRATAPRRGCMRSFLPPRCLHAQRPGRVGSHTAAARVAIEYHRSILTGTRRLTPSMAATAACSLAAVAAAVAALRSSEAPAAPTAAHQRQRAAARGGRRARRRWQADSHPASVSAWAVVREPHGVCQRCARSGMSVVCTRFQPLGGRAEGSRSASPEDAARDGPCKVFG